MPNQGSSPHASRAPRGSASKDQPGPAARRSGSGSGPSPAAGPAEEPRGDTGPQVSQAAASKQAEQLRDVLMEAARAELAAITAGIKFWAGWVEAADRYTQAIGAELARVSQGDQDSADLIGRLGDMTRGYLRSLAELPNVAVHQFNSEIEKVARPKARRTRAARIKD